MPDETEKQTNITINLSDTVPLQMYQTLEYRLHRLESKYEKDIAKLEKRLAQKATHIAKLTAMLEKFVPKETIPNA